MQAAQISPLLNRYQLDYEIWFNTIDSCKLQLMGEALNNENALTFKYKVLSSIHERLDGFTLWDLPVNSFQLEIEVNVLFRISSLTCCAQWTLMVFTLLKAKVRGPLL